jgi:hypothetical protein
VEAEVSARDPKLLELRDQLADARPGRAFFLQRKLADELAGATDVALNEAARQAHAGLVARALDFEASPPTRGAHGEPDRIEILRAA